MSTSKLQRLFSLLVMVFMVFTVLRPHATSTQRTIDPLALQEEMTDK